MRRQGHPTCVRMVSFTALLYNLLLSALAQLTTPLSSVPSSFSTVTRPTSTTSSAFASNTTFGLNATLPVDIRPEATDSGPDTSPGGDDDDPITARRATMLNYYFVFAALLVMFMFLGAYLLHLRKKKIKERSRNSGHNALARDLDGWVGSRRWMYGNWRQAPPPRQEGLNELGEAPPPYKPEPGQELPQIPLQTLARDPQDRASPPDYEAVAGHLDEPRR